MSKSIITTATFDKILVAKDKATVTLTMGPEMLYLAPQMASSALSRRSLLPMKW